LPITSDEQLQSLCTLVKNYRNVTLKYIPNHDTRVYRYRVFRFESAENVL